MKMQTIVSAFLSVMGKASGHPVKWSVIMRMSWFPDMETLRSVTKYIAILLKGPSGMFIICNGYIDILAFPSCTGCNLQCIVDVLIHSLPLVLLFDKVVIWAHQTCHFRMCQEMRETNNV